MVVDPGAARASVQGSRVTPYVVTVKIRAFDEAEWDAVLDVVSAQIGRVAALLDGELPPELVDDAQAAGLELLPDAGEVRTDCNCPDFAVPCKHSAAVCYLIADALDEDPFELLLLRGKQKDELLSALRARRSAPGEAPTLKPKPVGVVAKAAFARTPGPVPIPVRPLNQPGAPTAVQVLDPPRQSGVDGKDLVALATDAAKRAWELAAGDGDGGLSLTRDQDLARRAAGLLGTPGLADLAHRAGLTARQLTSWAVAWREAGPGGLAAATDPPATNTPSAVAERSAGAADSDPDPSAIAGAPVGAAFPDPSAMAEGVTVLDGVVEGNWITAERAQLRLAPDGLWYLFTKQFNDWMLSAPPSPDPAELLGGS
ncbi:SWIM zinc finger family protein [Kribbella sp. NBC_00382]|uniref:SWIM zinc finger family protein n=1 Tax=Kribbella sp. NBC_00382 TaxID=2975967 RepID=UPI002E23F773